MNINKSMSNKESKKFIQDLIAKGDPKLKPMPKPPMNDKDWKAFIQNNLDMLRRNPKLLNGLQKSQDVMDKKFGRDK